MHLSHLNHHYHIFYTLSGLLRAALAREAEWAAKIPGYNELLPPSSSDPSVFQFSQYKPPQVNPYLMGLIKLDQEKKLLQLAASVVEKSITGTAVTSSFATGNTDVTISDASTIVEGEKKQLDLKKSLLSLLNGAQQKQSFIREEKTFSSEYTKPESPVIVIIRHGKTEYNKLVRQYL